MRGRLTPRSRSVDFPFVLVTLALVLAIIAGCSSSTPTTPTPPPVVPPPAAAPTVACPASVTTSTTGTGAAVDFATPSPEGGQAPVSVSCTSTSGTTFPLGVTEVRCTATDARSQTGSCAFQITVTRQATISRTRFLAFGDSITEGIVSTENPSGSPPYILRTVPNESYPAVLRQLMASLYPTQTITVINEGKGGEKAVDGVGRAFTVMNANRPEVALIMDGYNDVALGDAGIDPAIAAINDMVKDARFRGARVFVGTLTPPTPGINRGLSGVTISRFNEKLKAMARGELAVVVDVHAAWEPARHNSADNRHPNEAGYRKIAETFLAAIRAELEVK